MDQFLRELQALLTSHFGTPAKRVTLHFPHVKMRIDLSRIPAAPAPPADRPTHSEDFRSVRALGRDFTFTPLQAAVVRVLWEAWEDGDPLLGQETLLERAGSDGNQLRDVFRSNNRTHPAWGLLIVPGGSRGTFRLALP